MSDANVADRLTVLRLAADAGVDPRSVVRALRGQRVRGIAGDRIARVLRERGTAVPSLALSSAPVPR